MLDERIAEFIQADVDGELAEEHRNELNLALEQSSDARAFRDEMKRVAEIFAQTPDIEPPAELGSQIIDSVDLPVRSSVITGHASWFKPASYGLAMAAGVLLAVGVGQLKLQEQQDMSQLVGSMVQNNHEVTTPSAGQLGIDIEAVQAQFRLSSLEQAWALEFDMSSDEAVNVVMDLNGTGLKFSGFANQDAGIEAFEVSGGKIRVSNQGTHQYVLFLRSVPGESASQQDMGIVVQQQGDEIYSGALGFRD
jgi:hypothetical protein